MTGWLATVAASLGAILFIEVYGEFLERRKIRKSIQFMQAWLWCLNFPNTKG